MSQKKKDLPAMPFYIGDWKKDPGIQSLNREEKMIWLEMLFLMWESSERGFLTVNGKPITNGRLAVALNLDNQKLSTMLTLFEELGLFSVRQEDNAIYSRKILNIVELSEKRKKAGKMGGNPVLINQNNKNRLTKTKAKGLTITENEIENENEIKEDKKSIEEIFEFWKVELNHQKSKLDKKRKDTIKARLKEGYSVERIKAAISGIKKSPHNMGINDLNTVYDDIELICRTGANVDRFADMNDKKTSKALTPEQAWDNVYPKICGNHIEKLDKIADEVIKDMGGYAMLGRSTNAKLDKISFIKRYKQKVGLK